jgi:hypothetical protein
MKRSVIPVLQHVIPGFTLRFIQATLLKKQTTETPRAGGKPGYFSITNEAAFLSNRFIHSTEEMENMDEDLTGMSRHELIAEIRKLRSGIRAHRDSSEHELCWHHPALWSLLPERTDPLPVVPAWPEFMRGCIRYRQSLDKQAPAAPRTDRPYED